MADLSNTIMDLKRDKKFYQEKLASTVEDLRSKQRVYSQQVSILNDKSDILRKRLADKFDKLSQIVLASKQTDDSIADVLKTATKEIEEMWFQKDNCIICTLQKPNCVVIPCRHQITCFQCTSFLATCSYCRVYWTGFSPMAYEYLSSSLTNQIWGLYNKLQTESFPHRFMALAQCIQAINKRGEMRICNLQIELRRRVGKKIFIISLMCVRPVQERFLFTWNGIKFLAKAKWLNLKSLLSC